MTKLYFVVLISLFGLMLSACTSSADTAPQKPTVLVGNAENGLIYYQTQCSACHAAGNDTSTAFNSSNLGKLLSSDRLDIIKSDMSTRGGINVNGTEIVPLMGRFKHVSPQRVADLKAFIKTL